MPDPSHLLPQATTPNAALLSTAASTSGGTGGGGASGGASGGGSGGGIDANAMHPATSTPLKLTASDPFVVVIVRHGGMYPSSPLTLHLASPPDLTLHSSAMEVCALA